MSFSNDRKIRVGRMKIGVFDARRFEQGPLAEMNPNYGFELVYFEPRLTLETLTILPAEGFRCPVRAGPEVL